MRVFKRKSGLTIARGSCAPVVMVAKGDRLVLIARKPLRPGEAELLFSEVQRAMETPGTALLIQDDMRAAVLRKGAEIEICLGREEE